MNLVLLPSVFEQKHNTTKTYKRPLNRNTTQAKRTSALKQKHKHKLDEKTM